MLSPIIRTVSPIVSFFGFIRGNDEGMYVIIPTIKYTYYHLPHMPDTKNGRPQINMRPPFLISDKLVLLFIHLRQLRCLVGCDTGINNLLDIPIHHLIQLVDCQTDSVVGDTSLWEVIGTNLL